MDRDPPDKPAPTRPTNGRTAHTHLTINRDSRKPLFGGPAPSKDNATERPGTAGHGPRSPATGHRARASTSRIVSPSTQYPNTDDSRIPRPRTTVPSSSHARRPPAAPPITLADAYRMAAAEEDDKDATSSQTSVDLSPSPAPRPWRARREAEKSKTSKPNTPSAGRRGKSDDSAAAEKGSPSTRGRLFGSARIGSRVAETGHALARKASTSSLGSSASASSSVGRGIKPPAGSGWLRRSAPREGTKAATTAGPVIPSIEKPQGSPVRPTPPLSRRDSADDDAVDDNDPTISPEKSYAWQVDDEFTAGDLQFSDSPRIRVDTRQPNTKLDEIRARELAMAIHVSPPDPPLDPPRNTKIDEIRSREMEILSRKALATSRLDEIREKNSQPRSLSPAEPRRQPSREFVRATSPMFDAPDAQPKGRFAGSSGEHIPNTPITVYRKTLRERNANTQTDAPKEGGDGNNGDDAPPKLSRNSSGSRSSVSLSALANDEPRDVLRRLARATSTSPSSNPDDGGRNRPISEEALQPDRNTAKNAAGASTTRLSRPSSPPRIKEPERERPTVGFLGLERPRSTESQSEKRYSMPNSDSDPTERLEREMQLFAPLENHSERGSIRAPSIPNSEDEDDDKNALEETPRPVKPDPLTMPTPRVTGAFVETPATVKPERPDEAQTAALGRGVGRSRSLSKSKVGDRGSARDMDGENDDDGTASRKAKGPRRRARSQQPRTRAPLINTANPPTVRDDILELQRAHQIEDSTLDDFGELLAAQRSTSPEIEDLLNEITAQAVDGIDQAIMGKMGDAGGMEIKAENGSSGSKEEGPRERRRDRKPDREKEELEAYGRMSKSLQTGLLGIRTAKQGIERLEGKVSHAELGNQKASTASSTSVKLPVDRAEAIKSRRDDDHNHIHTDLSHELSCPSCKAMARPSQTVTYLHLPIPRLYHTNPFRLTLLGLSAALFLAWYLLESTACALYCRPTTCSPGTPCIWTPTDPTFGTALPQKLDEWTTGGQGLRTLSQLVEDCRDIWADTWDSFTGRDILDTDTSTMDFYEKKRYRRRLRKKGLAKKRVEDPEEKRRWDLWRQERRARERAREEQEMGYERWEGSFEDDARVEERS